VEEKFLVAGIDMSGNIPKLAYWRTGDGEPQMLEAGEHIETDILSIIEQALSGLGATCFDSVVIVFSNADSFVKKESILKSINSVYKDTRVNFITCGESCAHYAMNQKKELRINDVAFFDWTKDAGLIYNRLHVTGSGGRTNAFVESRDCSDIVSNGTIEDECFKKLINELFEKQNISTVYLTGEGFINEEWAKESLSLLCNKRRVFKGQSIYAIGACYFGVWGCGGNSGVNEGYRLVCDGRTFYETCIEVVYKEEKKEAVLIPAGKLFHEIGDITVEGILSGEARLLIIRRALFGKEVKREAISLEAFESCYKDRMLRLIVNLSLINTNELLLTVSDAGFGDFVKKSGSKIEKVLGNA